VVFANLSLFSKRERRKREMENVFLNEGEKREIKRKIDLERERDKREEKRRER